MQSSSFVLQLLRGLSLIVLGRPISERLLVDADAEENYEPNLIQMKMFTGLQVRFLLKMMNFVRKTMDALLETTVFVLKMMNFVLKMMDALY